MPQLVSLDIEDVTREGLACASSPSNARAAYRRSGMLHLSRTTSWQSDSSSDAKYMGLQHCLLPWVKSLSVQLLVTVFFVTPPLVIFGWSTFTGMQLLHDFELQKHIISICVAVQVVYVVLRAVATTCSVFEVFLVGLTILWVGLLLVKRNMNSHELLEEVIAILWCVMFPTYALYLLRIGTAVRRVSRQLVSKKKRRYVDFRRGIDLDLTYISRRVIAMGFPSQSPAESQFRNSMEEVQRFLESRHKGRYKVYNLCIERTYTHKCFEREFHEVRFPDHNPCPLAKLLVICADMQAFIARSYSLNVVVVHCKAGKGRTGLVISAFLLHSRKISSAQEALDFFGHQRTFNGKGVTIPSQIRYVHHYEKVVREGGLRDPVWLRLQSLTATPEIAEAQTWRFQIMTHEDGTIFDSQEGEREEGRLPPLLEGDVKFAVFHHGTKLFQFWFHTAYDPVLSIKAQPRHGCTIWESHLPPPAAPTFTIALPRAQLDGAHKDKGGAHAKVPTALAIVATFHKPSGEEVHAQKLERDRRRAQREQEQCISQHAAHHAPQQRPSKQRNSRAPFCKVLEEVADYDALDNETDEEEAMSTLHRGYIFRSPGRCQKRVKRWAEISTSGCLYIVGRELLHVNVAQDADKVFQPVDHVAWKVKHSIHGRWELLEADPEEVKHWDQAFADSLRYGAASRDADTMFCGFFWKLNHDADAEKMRAGFDFADWRVRLFVLQRDGRVITYSWKDQQEVTFVNFLEPGCKVERAPFSWRSKPKTVPFQVVVSGAKPRVLAAREEDFNAFMSCVSSVRLRAPPGRVSEQLTRW